MFNEILIILCQTFSIINIVFYGKGGNFLRYNSRLVIGWSQLTYGLVIPEYLLPSKQYILKTFIYLIKTKLKRLFGHLGNI